MRIIVVDFRVEALSDLMKKLSEAVQKQQKDRDNTSSNHANVKED